jgi:hypothetical protein
MATLQAARASALGLDKDEAYSWGLNRAIFYAAAKQGFKSAYSHAGGSGKGEPKEGKPTFSLGDELAYKENQRDKSLFVIGGKAQTPNDFEKQVVSRFGGKFDAAWKEAIQIVEGEDKETLLSQRKFYEDVYKPRRDDLSKKWTEITADQKGERTSTVHKARVKVKAS